MAAKVVTGLDDNKRLSILDELRPEKQSDGDITIQEAMEDWDVNFSAARTELENAVKDKILKRVYGIRKRNNRRGLFYRRIEK